MKIVIIGSGTTAKSVVNILLENKSMQIAGFLGNDNDNKKYSGKNVISNFPFLGSYELLEDLNKIDIRGFIVAIGDNRLRERIYYKALKCNLIPINAISKQSIISNSALIDKGVIIKPGCIIGHDVNIRQNTKIYSIHFQMH